MDSGAVCQYFLCCRAARRCSVDLLPRFRYLTFSSRCVPQYDPRFGDAFWNSAKHNMVSYLLRMMTSWAIVVNVWYLPPMTIQVQLSVERPPFCQTGTTWLN